MKLTHVLLASSALALAVAACSSAKKPEPVPAPEPVAEQKAATPQPAVTLKTIYFDFDKYEIRADQKTDADTMASSLKSNPSVHVQIQGNCDDRGSAEYNLALGEKRATSLKNYLVANGVSADNIETISYGKERPAVQGHNEEAWARNRRDDVVTK